MNKTLLIWLACLGCSAFAPLSAAQQFVYVVRHGERMDDSKDSPLSVAGEARAGILAKTLAASGVKAIYTTQYRRTMPISETAFDNLFVLVPKTTGPPAVAWLKY